MNKKQLMSKLNELLEEKGMSKIELSLGGKIDWNCNKSTIEDAIKCLEMSDEEMNEYLTVFKLKYKNTYDCIMQAGNWLTHSHNRYYVYSSVKTILEK